MMVLSWTQLQKKRFVFIYKVMLQIKKKKNKKETINVSFPNL